MVAPPCYNGLYMRAEKREKPTTPEEEGSQLAPDAREGFEHTSVSCFVEVKIAQNSYDNPRRNQAVYSSRHS